MTLQSSRTDISSDCLKSLTGANCNLGFMKSFFFYIILWEVQTGKLN